MKQKEIARQLDVTPQHLNAILKKRTRPSLKLALKLESVLGLPAEQFLPELKIRDTDSH